MERGGVTDNWLLFRRRSEAQGHHKVEIRQCIGRQSRIVSSVVLLCCEELFACSQDHKKRALLEATLLNSNRKYSLCKLKSIMLCTYAEMNCTEVQNPIMRAQHKCKKNTSETKQKISQLLIQFQYLSLVCWSNASSSRSHRDTQIDRQTHACMHTHAHTHTQTKYCNSPAPACEGLKMRSCG